MNEENLEQVESDVLENDYDISTAILLDDSDVMESVSSGDAGEDELSNESDVGESDNVVYSTVVVSEYSEAEQQADSELIGSVTVLNETCLLLNETCTLILFFLLFSWVDKKIQAIVNGVSGK